MGFYGMEVEMLEYTKKFSSYIFDSVRLSCNTVEELRYDCAIIATYTKEKYIMFLLLTCYYKIAQTLFLIEKKKNYSFLYPL
jgi:hypothetical protein